MNGLAHLLGVDVKELVQAGVALVEDEGAHEAPNLTIRATAEESAPAP